ncbi:hypothetical protein [Streptomyces sp. SLBN-134]|uniref:hypothetical protein n=1 Tax=Streptomyces sp. SLBN-134 TaxID=2768456 RepID=UPI0011530740|nr:hypothetical protein [Streptomyces sp. SLBN-134]TQL14680.1 hypothetical protein FBY37_6912 [Streptomyces sp. SLBN-134]
MTATPETTPEADDVRARMLAKTYSPDDLARSVARRIGEAEALIVEHVRKGQPKEAQKVSAGLEALDRFASEFIGPGWREWVRTNPET